jgi:serralysin
MEFLRCAPIAALVGLALVANPVQATFHLWDIVEVYSNFDGSVQFVEMFDASNFENLVSGKQLKSNANSFTIPANLTTTATANHRLLFATAGFSALAGGVTPDYTIPSNFFSITGDTLNFANVNIRTFPSIPTDGVTSLNFPSNTAAVNSPTNFAGAAGSIDLSPVPEPTTIVLTLTLSGLMPFTRRWPRR